MNDQQKNLKHSIIASNRALKQNQDQHQQGYQSQSSFERQIALSSSGGIAALSESVPGERRSFPRASSNSTRHDVLETIRRQLQHVHIPHSRPLNNGISNQKDLFKSNSYTDLREIDLLARGFDEESVAEVLRNHQNSTLRKVNKQVNGSNRVNTIHRSQQPRSTQHPNMGASSQHSQGQLPSKYSYYKHPQEAYTSQCGYDPSVSTMNTQHTMYQPSSHFSSESEHTLQNSINDSPWMHKASDQSSKMTSDFDSGRNNQISGRNPNNSREIVTLRNKTTDVRSNTQNRWSAEVMVKPQYNYDKQNSSEGFPKKPPPPYPGPTKTSLHRIMSQEGEFRTSKNTPITVIFDPPNNRVNVVDGIPEGFEISPSSPSSEQSSPRSIQKDPPPYEFAAVQQQNSKSFNPQTNKVQGQQNINLLHQKSYPETSSSGMSRNQTTQSTMHRPVQTSQQHSTSQTSGESTFTPIRSPPPYPGASSSSSSFQNRSSLNIDELEGYGSNGSVSSSNFSYPPSYQYPDSATSSKKTSITTDPGPFQGSFQSDSSASTSPTSDGVVRACSPLPVVPTSCETMVIHNSDKKENNHTSDSEPFSTRLKNYTPQAYKFFMEQHVENIMKQREQRKIRKMQLEAEMRKVGLPIKDQNQMRKLLNQKESNYIRLKRAKMDKSMFSKIKRVGVGAFGEVSLVCKKGTSAYYAMKTLRKSEVLRRNQVAHVKAERDILAEADNEWVVKLYYSFQDMNNLYFVMDYVPGGDLMALLIKFGIFEEPLARFYISELVLAIESVHKLGFIHRDIKPDNILIDKNGHIKLTDFGLCTGFRWTHDSKYYQPEPEGGGHSRQYSMEPEGGWESLLNDVNCNCKSHRLQYDLLKPLERRKLRRHMRCQAHSLVGTPNYIAPEVLLRVPYSQQCDWWSVGVIMYEMLIGQPPFLAQSPAETQYKVINWRHILSIPKNHLPEESEDLIRKLCAAPEERLGKDGANEIKEHPYFIGVDFESVHQQQAPHVPIIRNATDTSNFDPVPEEICENDDDETAEACVPKSGPEYAFYEFTFRHFFDDGGLVNPNQDFDMEEMEEEPKQGSKRPARNETNYSNPVPPSKVPATSNSTSEVYV